MAIIIWHLEVCEIIIKMKIVIGIEVDLHSLQMNEMATDQHNHPYQALLQNLLAIDDQIKIYCFTILGGKGHTT